MKAYSGGFSLLPLGMQGCITNMVLQGPTVLTVLATKGIGLVLAVDVWDAAVLRWPRLPGTCVTARLLRSACCLWPSCAVCLTIVDISNLA